MLPTTGPPSTNQPTNPRYDFLVDLANTIKAFLGINFIVVAYGFSKAGLLRGIIGLIVIVIITEHCCLLLIQVKNSLYQPLPTASAESSDSEESHHPHQYQHVNNIDTNTNINRVGTSTSTSITTNQQQQVPPTFGDIAFRVGGKKAELFITACVILTQFGYCVGYLIFISQTLHDLLSSTAPVPLFILAPLPIVLLIALLQSIRSLGPFSAFANGALLFGFVAVVTFIIRHFNWTPTKVPLTSFPMFFGQMTAAIEGIGLVVPLEASMRRKKNFKIVLRIALSGLTVILMVVGVLGFATFGADTRSIILLNFGQSPVVVAVKAVLIVGILFTYPLQIIPVFEFAERLFLKDTESQQRQQQSMRHNRYTHAAAGDDDDDDEDGNSNRITSTDSEAAVTSQFRILDEGDDDDDETAAYSTSGSMNMNRVNMNANMNMKESRHTAIEDSNSDDTAIQVERNGDRREREEEKTAAETEDNSIFLRDKRRIAIRLGTVLLTAVIAVLAGSSFGVFNALVGSMGASMLAYTAPAMFHNIAFGEELSTPVKVKNWVIAVMGVLGAIAGTFSALWEIVEIHRGNSVPA